MDSNYTKHLSLFKDIETFTIVNKNILQSKTSLKFADKYALI